MTHSKLLCEVVVGSILQRGNLDGAMLNERKRAMGHELLSNNDI